MISGARQVAAGASRSTNRGVTSRGSRTLPTPLASATNRMNRHLGVGPIPAVAATALMPPEIRKAGRGATIRYRGFAIAESELRNRAALGATTTAGVSRPVFELELSGPRGANLAR